MRGSHTSPLPVLLRCVQHSQTRELLQQWGNLSRFIQLSLFAYLRLIFFPVILAANAHADTLSGKSYVCVCPSLKSIIIKDMTNYVIPSQN